MKRSERTSSGRVHATEGFFETRYSPHSTADCIHVCHWRVTIQTSLYGQEKVLLGCDTVFAWLDSDWKKRKNCWIYFMVKFMAKLLTEQDELLERVSVINQNK